MNDIIQFIRKRFPNDSHWTDGNCFYFSTILKARFPDGTIYYDVVRGHFLFEHQGAYYDWSGLQSPTLSDLVKWENFDKYDISRMKRIIRDCIL